jgi:hypothetical protein
VVGTDKTERRSTGSVADVDYARIIACYGGHGGTSRCRLGGRAGARMGRDRDLGMAFDFPAHIFSLESSEEVGEGILFSTPDNRARIRVFGFRNEANDTPRRYLRRIANAEQARFTYVRTTPRFFVASGTHDGMIFYRRCNFFGDKRVSCFQLDYPEGEKREWDNIVTRISLSLAAAD